MLKIGDKIKMNKAGVLNHNPDNMFDAHNVGGVISEKHLKQLLCEFIAIQGIGEIKEVKSDCVRVKFKNNLNGHYFYFTMWYEVEHLKKLTILDKIVLKLRKLLC